MRMTRAQWDDLIAHAREDAPNECCGYMRIRDGAVVDVIRGVNERDSPYGYQLDAMSHYGAYVAEEDGFVVGMYHSHPKSSADPSQTDINLAEFPSYLYVIVSLLEPEVRAWRIADGKVTEEPIEVT
jgi:proteasome lid subunit RPN8/RPN11